MRTWTWPRGRLVQAATLFAMFAQLRVFGGVGRRRHQKAWNPERVRGPDGLTLFQQRTQEAIREWLITRGLTASSRTVEQAVEPTRPPWVVLKGCAARGRVQHLRRRGRAGRQQGDLPERGVSRCRLARVRPTEVYSPPRRDSSRDRSVARVTSRASSMQLLAVRFNLCSRVPSTRRVRRLPQRPWTVHGVGIRRSCCLTSGCNGQPRY